jgi:nucleotide-binding universal stress UspA family protein
MDCSTLLVNLTAGRSNSGLLQVASHLAERHGAAVIGVAAKQPVQIDVSGTCYISPGIYDDMQAETEAEISRAEAEFRAVFQGRDVDWCSSVGLGSPADFILDQVRRADVLLTGMPLHPKADATSATAGELIMQCGRPVLVVPPAPASPSLDRVMLAWKDTREARRAALDALPLLRTAAYVGVVEIAAEEDMAAARQHVDDVARWLGKHGIVVDAVAAASGDDDAAQLESAAQKSAANLVVAGAYGHNRVREWAFGGVTRTLVQHADRCALLSH